MPYRSDESIEETRRRLDIENARRDECPTPDEIAERSDAVVPLPDQIDAEGVDLDIESAGRLRPRATREEIEARLRLHVATVDGLLAELLDQIDAEAAEQLDAARRWIHADARAIITDVFDLRPYKPGVDVIRSRETIKQPAHVVTEDTRKGLAE